VGRGVGGVVGGAVGRGVGGLVGCFVGVFVGCLFCAWATVKRRVRKEIFMLKSLDLFGTIKSTYCEYLRQQSGYEKWLVPCPTLFTITNMSMTIHHSTASMRTSVIEMSLVISHYSLRFFDHWGIIYDYYSIIHNSTIASRRTSVTDLSLVITLYAFVTIGEFIRMISTIYPIAKELAQLNFFNDHLQKVNTQYLPVVALLVDY
jgi:hypothetical protein